MLRNFAAIDFETANRSATSICSVGVVVVREGKVVDRIYRLVQPAPNFYNYHNTRIHGLTTADTDHEEVFPLVWKEVEEHIKGLPLVAHNKGFDERCLKAAFEAYQMDYPNYLFYCTLSAARRQLKNLPNHQLQTVAENCGYLLQQHHHALADAEACAQIALELL